MSTFNTALIELASNTDAQQSIAYGALDRDPGYSGSGKTMTRLAVECVGYWLSVGTNAGTVEDMRELEEIFDNYAEYPSPTLEEKISLIGELWNHETHGREDSLDGHIDQWCAEVGYNTRYAIQAYLENVAD